MHSRRRFFGLVAGAACSVLAAAYGVGSLVAADELFCDWTGNLVVFETLLREYLGPVVTDLLGDEDPIFRLISSVRRNT